MMWIWKPILLKSIFRSIFKCDIPELDTHVVLVLNGFYYSSQPGMDNCPKV